MILLRTTLTAMLVACAAAANAAPRQVTLSVPTMDCETCPVTIRIALMKVPGVKSAVVSYKKRNAVVTFDDAATNVAALSRATDEAGYPSFAAGDVTSAPARR
jgi:mercuric ion binding protein